MTITAQAESLLCGFILGTVLSALCTLSSILTTTSEVRAALCLDVKVWELRLRVVGSHAEVTQLVIWNQNSHLGSFRPAALPPSHKVLKVAPHSVRTKRGASHLHLLRAWHKAAPVLTC